MSKRKPYTPPRVIRYESEAEYPDWTGDIVLSLRQELEAPQFEVKPHYVTVVDSDRKYVEVSDSFCQLVGYQREVRATSRLSLVYFKSLDTCMVCGCSLVVRVPAFWSDMKHGFDLTPISKDTWRL